MLKSLSNTMGPVSSRTTPPPGTVNLLKGPSSVMVFTDPSGVEADLRDVAAVLLNERGPFRGCGHDERAAGRPGADDGIRTRDPHLGNVVLYQLSHVRVC